MNAEKWCIKLNSICRFMSTEVPGKVASNSEIRRWIEQGVIVMNGERLSLKEEIDFPVFSVVLFPKSIKRKTTLL